MTRIETILAVTDFSVHALHAAERAALLAAESGARQATLLHVVEGSWLDSLKRLVNVPTDVEQRLIEEARAALAKLSAKVQLRAGAALAPQVRVGHVADEILASVADHELLVLGARGSHPVREFALGTMAQRLLRRTARPVLVVKRKPAGAYRRVLVAVDFSPYAARAFAFAPVIAPQAAEICLMHVFEPPFEGKMYYAGVAEGLLDQVRSRARVEAESEMERFIAASGLDGRPLVPIIEYGYAPSRLHEKACELDADLVVVGKHGRSLGEELLLGSVTQHLLAESHCDVLVIR